MVLASVPDVILGGLIAAIAGVLASVVGTVGQSWLAKRAREADYRMTAIRDSAKGWGKSRSLLREMAPEPLIALPDSEEQVEKLIWRAGEIQDELEILAAAHPRDDVRQAADSMIETMRKLRGDLKYYTQKGREQGHLTPEQWNAVKESHAAAIHASDELLEAIRR